MSNSWHESRDALMLTSPFNITSSDFANVAFISHISLPLPPTMSSRHQLERALGGGMKTNAMSEREKK